MECITRAVWLKYWQAHAQRYQPSVNYSQGRRRPRIMTVCHVFAGWLYAILLTVVEFQERFGVCDGQTHGGISRARTLA
jgi:hypothetical protein